MSIERPAAMVPVRLSDAGKPYPTARCGQVALLSMLLLAADPLPAQNPVHLRIAHAGHPQFEAEHLELDLVPSTGEQPPRLALRVSRLRLPALDRTLREAEFSCQAEAEPAPAPVAEPAATTGGWRCQGPLRWRSGESGWQLRWRGDLALTRGEIRISQGNSSILLQLPLADAALSLQARRFRATWLASLLPQLQWQSGSVDADLALDASNDDARWHGQVGLRQLAAQTEDGWLAWSGVTLAGPVELRQQGESLSLTAKPRLDAGELLAGASYLSWPAGSAVELDVALTSQRNAWGIERFSLRDGAFAMQAKAALDTGAEPVLRSLSADFQADLALHYARYLDSTMAAWGQSDLQAGGGIEGSVQLTAGGVVESFDARLDQVSLRHPEGRYRLEGLDGDLAFRRDPRQSAPVQLDWRHIDVHVLPFGAGRLRGSSSGGEIRANEAIRVGLFGGQVGLDGLVLRPQAEQGDRLRASLAVQGVDLGALTSAFGWPFFGGRLDATLPNLRYADERLDTDGDLAIQAFDGTIAISDLSVERPFGVAPALAGDVRLRSLDLQPMTEVFGFGRIEGRLDGEIEGLRLLDWRPVAFDARLHTQEKGRRRISQLAVEQLTSVGGGGTAGGIQGRLLGVFDSFGYRRIAWSCRLANDVCTMGGIDGDAGGYTILQGSGLPLITIRGFQRQVDWPVLVDRLQAVVSGQAPVVD